MKKWYLVSFSILLVFIMSIVACSQGSSNSSKDKQYTIVTSFYPMYVFTKNITNDITNVKVVNMTKPQTGCLHDYQLSPSDMKTLEKADALVINGAGMESFMDKVTNQLPSVKVVEASKNINLLKDENGEENPHIWVGISGAIEEVKNITEGLSKANPENADKYRKNSEEYIKKLEMQEEKMHKELDNIKNKDIVTFHEAFPYFAKEFGLNIVAVVEREPGTEPSAGELADTMKKIKQTNVKVLFAEPQYSQKAAQSIAKETGAKVYILDPFVTGENNAPNESYIDTMDKNLGVLKEALK